MGWRGGARGPPLPSLSQESSAGAQTDSRVRVDPDSAVGEACTACRPLEENKDKIASTKLGPGPQKQALQVRDVTVKLLQPPGNSLIHL